MIKVFGNYYKQKGKVGKRWRKNLITYLLGKAKQEKVVDLKRV